MENDNTNEARYTNDTMIESMIKLGELLKRKGFDFRNAEEMMDELVKGWDLLSEDEKGEVARLLACGITEEGMIKIVMRLLTLPPVCDVEAVLKKFPEEERRRILTNLIWLYNRARNLSWDV